MSLLGLVPDYGSDSSSSSESDDEETKLEGSARNSIDDKNAGSDRTPQIPLPLPSLDLKATSSDTKEVNQRTYQTSSVFFNPFLAEEKKKLSVLEKHVQLSEVKVEEDKYKSRKNICFKFQKGRCRLGDRCKFSHGTADTRAPTSSETEKPKVPSFTPSISTSRTRYEPDEDEESWELKKKKRKPGVTDTLVPPKRSMAAYEKQRLNDKPWSQS